MILLDQPYVSEFLKQTILEERIPLIDTGIARNLMPENGANWISEKEVVQQYKIKPFLIYTNSENAIEWVNRNLNFSKLPGQIDVFKDKFKFRELTKSLLPDFYYREIKVNDIIKLRYEDLPAPCILKPVVGFFSMGVYMIESEKDLQKAIIDVTKEIEIIHDLYPKEVLDVDRFIIEEYIEGEEFAFDAFFDSKGEPAIVGIMKHLFASSDDVGDRVYYTSKPIIERYVPLFEDFLNQLGKLIHLKNYPLHVEVRVNEQGQILPIEVNPLRTGGWCTSADLANHAFGYNPISCMLNDEKPDWESILQDKGDTRFSIVILTNTTGLKPENIYTVDYNSILKRFKKPLELRKSDFNKQPHFGFLFVETQVDDWEEIEDILTDDLKKYVVGNKS